MSRPEWPRRSLLEKVASAVVVAARHGLGGRWDAATAAVGATFGTPAFAGQWVLVPVGSAELAVHLGPAGRLEVVDGHPDLDDRPNAPLRALWLLTAGDGSPATLVLHDPRGFSRLHWTEDPAPAAPVAQPLVRPETLAGSPRPVKSLLVGVSVRLTPPAADAALWTAGVHPDARHLDHDAARRVCDAVGGDAALRHPGAAGASCPRCSAPLGTGVVDGLRATFCESCQVPHQHPQRRRHDAPAAV